MYKYQLSVLIGDDVFPIRSYPTKSQAEVAYAKCCLQYPNTRYLRNWS